MDTQQDAAQEEPDRQRRTDILRDKTMIGEKGKLRILQKWKRNKTYQLPSSPAIHSRNCAEEGSFKLWHNQEY